MSVARRVAIVQYAGDYREALQRLSAGGSETYFAQRYSVTSVAELRNCTEDLAVVVCHTETAYDERLPNGVRAIGCGYHGNIDIPSLINILRNFRPTELVLCTPLRALLTWAVKQKLRTLTLFADSFPQKNLRDRFRNFQIARLLNNKNIEWVANHNLNSSKSLSEIGVKADKIIPWDWIPRVTPAQFKPKEEPPASGAFSLMYAGAIIEDKGVGDLLRAVAILNQRALPVVVKLAGKGDLEKFQALAKQLEITHAVEFLGLVPNEQIVTLMRAAGAVVIPSRHTYAEGLPMTIYEGLCSRTPIIASDHPMFRGRLVDGQSALIFHAGDANDLTTKIQNLFSDPKLYQQLSQFAAEAWERIQIPVKFGELLSRWVADSPENREWLHSFRLASGRYDSPS
jgi:glycosyltransferase involved in cell wall biosynthesis